MPRQDKDDQRVQPRPLERCAANAVVWKFLEPRLRAQPVDPYLGAGSHPDVVVRVWDQLGADLPSTCRALMGGVPVLAHPLTDAVLAFPLGTSYALLVPQSRRERAIELGLSPTQRWGGGSETDLLPALGEGWYFGKWQLEEKEWCEQAYREAS
jgi:hypothetical protein